MTSLFKLRILIMILVFACYICILPLLIYRFAMCDRWTYSILHYGVIIFVLVSYSAWSTSSRGVVCENAVIIDLLLILHPVDHLLCYANSRVNLLAKYPENRSLYKWQFYTIIIHIFNCCEIHENHSGFQLNQYYNGFTRFNNFIEMWHLVLLRLVQTFCRLLHSKVVPIYFFVEHKFYFC